MSSLPAGYLLSSFRPQTSSSVATRTETNHSNQIPMAELEELS